MVGWMFDRPVLRREANVHHRPMKLSLGWIFYLGVCVFLGQADGICVVGNSSNILHSTHTQSSSPAQLTFFFFFVT
jgi:hypothetical protein